MKFGKLQDITAVDFSMPPPPLFNQKVLDNTMDSSPKIYWGCTGWSMKEWVGKYYPEGTKSKDFLKYYSQQFSTIELNTTHYRIPTSTTIEKWYEESDANFKFAPKMPQIISHSNDLALGNHLVNQFCTAVAGLEDKLGTTFMQMPPNFDYKKINLLEAFLQKFPCDEIPLAIELRHQEWFSNTTYFDHLLDLLHQYNTSTVLTDVAGRRDVLHLALTTPTAMVRFVGNELHDSDFQRVDAWVRLLKKWLAEGLQEVYFFSHQPDNILSPEMCSYFIGQMEKHCQIVFDKKTKILPPSGQMSLF